MDTIWLDRRRRWSEEQKRNIVNETLLPSATVSSVARKYKVPLASLFRWRRELRQDASQTAFQDKESIGSEQVRRLVEQVHTLQRILGRMILENELLRESIRFSRVEEPAVSIPA